MTNKLIDHPAVVRVLYYPRPGGGFSLAAKPVLIEVEPGVSIGGYLHPAGKDAPAILFFHGNGEIADDYGDIAQAYTRLGLTFLVVDYRGYGQSGGRPSGSNQLSDAVAIFEALDGVFMPHALQPDRIYVMGRSLGSASAIEVAAHAGDRLAGLILESGFADTLALIELLGGPVVAGDDAQIGFGNAAKMWRISIPTLIIHGEWDNLIPASEGRTLYEQGAAHDKRLVLIPRAGHNDLMIVGLPRYFAAIAEFI
jgi:pimeloyl-ACP methyl ester carboxylesterase